jgi:hypothetical protein
MSGCKLEDNLFDIQYCFVKILSLCLALHFDPLVMNSPCTGIHSFVDWFESYSLTRIDSQLLGLLDRVLYTDLDGYHSGGGMYHIFFHLQDRRILTVNVTDFSMELSFDPWDSIHSYYDSGNGFGFEYDLPDYDSRVLYDYASEEEFENLMKGHLV